MQTQLNWLDEAVNTLIYAKVLTKKKIQNPAGQSPEQPALDNPALSRRLDYMISRSASNLSNSVFL